MMKKSATVEEMEWMEQRERNGQKYWVSPGTSLMLCRSPMQKAMNRNFLIPPDDPSYQEPFILVSYEDHEWDSVTAKISWSRGYEFFEAIGLPFDCRVAIGARGGQHFEGEMEERIWDVCRKWGCIETGEANK